MNKKILLIITVFVLISCSVKTVKDYYVLSYMPDPEGLSRFKVSGLPIDAKVQVQNFEMNRIYDRNSIVIRESLHKLSFDEKNNWALRPDRALPELIVYHINSAGIFKECKSDFISASPDYYITGTINNIEIYSNDNNIFAHVNVSLELRDKSRTILVAHQIDAKRDIKKYDITFFVKTAGEILKEGAQDFLVEIVDYFKSQKQ